MYTALNVIGPKAQELLQELTETPLDRKNFSSMTAKEINVAYASGIKALRLTHTGEDGWVCAEMVNDPLTNDHVIRWFIWSLVNDPLIDDPRLPAHCRPIGKFIGFGLKQLPLIVDFGDRNGGNITCR